MLNVVPLHPSNQTVFVLQVRRTSKDGAVRAYVDIQYHGATIRGLKIVRYNDSHFMGMPSDLIRKTGKWRSMVEFSQPDHSQIEALVLEAGKNQGAI